MIQKNAGIPLKQGATTFVLGFLFGMAPLTLIGFTLSKPLPFQLQVYLASMAVAHMGEYMFVLCFHPSELKWDSYLINQSKAYMIAAVFSWVEFFVFFGKKPLIMNMAMFPLGVIFIITGHCIRIGAMFTARKSFHHIV